MVRTRRRLSPPAYLVKNRLKLEARFRQLPRGSSKWATAGCKRSLIAELRKLTHGKCVYCEHMLEVGTYIEVEHYIAKTIDESLVFEWTNLLPVCRLCNGSKAYDDHRRALLKPDDEDPEPYFWLHAGTGELRPHPNLTAAETIRAEETIRLCDLQRGALCAKRSETIELTDLLLKVLADENILPQTRQRAWKALSDPKREYKFVVRHVLTLKGRRDLADEDRRLFQH